MNTQKELDVLVKYATGERIDDTSYGLIRFFLQHINLGTIAEAIVSNFLGYKNSDASIHGEDAINREGRPVEIKSESAIPLSGNAAWNSTNYEEKVDSLYNSNQEFILSGFTKEGRLVYILRMNLNDTGIIDSLYDQTMIGAGNRKKNLTPKTTHTVLPNNFEVVYLSEKYLNKTKFNNVFKQKILAAYQKQTFVGPKIPYEASLAQFKIDNPVSKFVTN